MKKFVERGEGQQRRRQQTTKLWRKALDEMWAGDLDEAIVDFEEVMTLFPTHSEAPRMTKQARALKKDGKGKTVQAASERRQRCRQRGSGDQRERAGGGGGGSGAGIAVAVILVLAGVIGAIVVGHEAQEADAGAGARHAPADGAHPACIRSTARTRDAPAAADITRRTRRCHHPALQQGGADDGARRAPDAPTAGREDGRDRQPSGSQPIAATAFGSITIGEPDLHARPAERPALQPRPRRAC